jgi:hypothetical protein
MGSRCRAESCHDASTSNTVTTDGLSVSVPGGAEQLRQFTYAGRGFTVSRRLGHEGNKRVTLHLWCGVKRAQSQEKSNVERETGLEPATPCLEGAAPSQRHTITLPFWRKVAPHADHSSSLIITHHHSSSLIVTHRHSSSLIITHHHSSSLIVTHHRVVIGRVPARQTGMRCGGASHALPRASVTI